MTKLKIALLGALTLAMLVFGINGCVSVPVYNGPPTDHFDGNVFHNRVPSEKGFWDIAQLGIYSL